MSLRISGETTGFGEHQREGTLKVLHQQPVAVHHREALGNDKIRYVHSGERIYFPSLAGFTSLHPLLQRGCQPKSGKFCER